MTSSMETVDTSTTPRGSDGPLEQYKPRAAGTRGSIVRDLQKMTLLDVCVAIDSDETSPHNDRRAGLEPEMR